jgi:hypothetical protein
VGGGGGGGRGAGQQGAPSAQPRHQGLRLPAPTGPLRLAASATAQLYNNGRIRTRHRSTISRYG